MELLRESASDHERRTLHGHLDRRWRAETHGLADDVRGLKRDRDVRQRLLQLSTQFFLQFVGDPRGFRFQRHAQDSLVLSAGKQVNRVDRIVGRLDADEAGGNVDVLRPHPLPDHIHRLQSDHFGAFEARAGWRA